MWVDIICFCVVLRSFFLYCASAKYLVFKCLTEIGPVTNLNLNRLLKFKRFLKVTLYAIERSLCNYNLGRFLKC